MGRVITSTSALEASLHAAVPGGAETGTRRRAEYAADASNYRHVPQAVVFPSSADDVAAAVEVCRREGVPVTMRGGGTSVGGSAVGEGVVLDCSRRFNRVLGVDPERRIARVEPGVVLDDLQAAAAPYGLLFGPDPSTHGRCTLGGMIGNNACGSRSLAWGRTSDNIASLDVLLADGTRLTVGRTPRDAIDRIVSAGGREAEVYGALRDLATRHLATIRSELGRFRRQASGYALEHLLPENGFDLARALVGSEGTCAVVLGAEVRLVQAPRARALLVLGYDDLAVAADAVPAIVTHRPLACEGLTFLRPAEASSAHWNARGPLDPVVAAALPAGEAWLLVEFGGKSVREAEARAQEAAAALGNGAVVMDSRVQAVLWRIREDGAGLATRLPDGSEAWPGWEDAAVPPDRLGSYLRGFRDLMARHGRRGVAYGHFGDGCVHVRIDFDLLTPQGIRGFRAFVEEAADLVTSHGGSLSGEHGDGQARSELLRRMYGPDALRAFEEFKRAWDPDDLFNPGVVVRPRPLDADLRFGVTGGGRSAAFAYVEDAGDFARATRRCVGIARCRTGTGGVMCPSYRATGDERDSTRGRARVLQEMVRGDLVTDGWRSDEVRDVLDLCLACKGCKSDCPVGVDMATYKAEFLHHHYRWRPRPASHWSMGWLPVWAWLAAAAPGAANALASRLRGPGGLTFERPLPHFAPQTFRAQWRDRRRERRPERRPERPSHRQSARPSQRQSPPRQGRPVVLWVDTFTDHFVPQVARAAVEVLESAGFAVTVPSGWACCGITWVSTGQLGVARRVMRRTLSTLGGGDVPVVGLEPSCTATLRSDLPDLLPGDPRAAALAARVHTLAQLLERHAPEWTPPRIDRSALTQVHCHQHAVLGFAAEQRLLSRLGLNGGVLDVGCCGLAGSFGYERQHYAVSVAVAEHALLPALRAADPAAYVLADGFSCRTQIEQLAGRPVLHLAELLAGPVPVGMRPPDR